MAKPDAAHAAAADVHVVEAELIRHALRPLAPGSGSDTLWTTTNFTIQLACNAPSGVCP